MLGEKDGKLFRDSVSEVIRVISKVDGVGFTAFLAVSVFVPYMGTTLMDCP